MKSEEVDTSDIMFRGEGSNVVENPRYDQKKSKSYINKTQFFEGAEIEHWEFYIGGYQVCQKWLKDRKGRTLTGEEIEHYQKIVVAIKETIRIMKEIDEVIEEHGGWPIK